MNITSPEFNLTPDEATEAWIAGIDVNDYVPARMAGVSHRTIIRQLQPLPMPSATSDNEKSASK